MPHLATDADTGHNAASTLTGRIADDGLQIGLLLNQVVRSIMLMPSSVWFERLKE